MHEAIKNHEENAKESRDRETKMADDNLMYRVTITLTITYKHLTLPTNHSV